jgi:iron-sulfur cluster assembly 2
VTSRKIGVKKAIAKVKQASGLVKSLLKTRPLVGNMQCAMLRTIARSCRSKLWVTSRSAFSQAATNVEIAGHVSSTNNLEEKVRTITEQQKIVQESEKSTVYASGAQITLSSSAVSKMRTFDHEKDGYLRLVVEGGGCAGFTARFELDKRKGADDCVIEQDGAKLVVDEASLPFVNGAVVDFQHELIRSGFRLLTNPNAEKRCSCGASFALKELEVPKKPEAK